MGRTIDRRQRLFALLFGLCVLLGVICTPTCLYAESSECVTVTILSDKATYHTGDTATFTVNIANESVRAVEDVSYAIELPEGMEPVDEATTKGVIPTLNEGESVDIMIEARVAEDSQVDVDVPGNTIPQTGDSSSMIVIVCTSIGVLLCCAAYVVHKQKKGVGLLVIGALLVAAASSSLSARTAYAAENASPINTVEATCDVNVNDNERTAWVSVTYVNSEDVQPMPDPEPSGMTRGEWVKTLLDGTGAVALETNAEPYDDIAGNEYEDEIKTAWLLEILPDENGHFNPSAPATRDFVYSVAVLAADVEDGSLVFSASDADQAEHPNLLAAAVENGLASLDESGKFEPQAPFDSGEVDSLVNKIVELATKDEENPGASSEGIEYKYRRDVQVSRDYIELGEFYQVNDLPDLRVGDRVSLEPSSVEEGGIAGTVVEVSAARSASVVKIEPVPRLEDVFSEINLQPRLAPIRSSDIELAEGVTFSDNAAANARYREDLEQINLNFSYPEEGDGASVSGSISIQPYVNIELKWKSLFEGLRNFDLGFGADTTLTGTVKAKASDSVRLGKFTLTPYPGVDIAGNLELKVSVDGQIQLAVSMDSEAGVKYNRVIGMEGYGGFDSDSTLEFNAHSRIGIYPWLSLDLLKVPLVDGSFEAGLDGEGSTVVRDTGLVCNDTSLYAYARLALGENSPIFQYIKDEFDWSAAVDLWDEDTSPFSGSWHWENGVIVDECTYNSGGSGGVEGGTGTGIIDPEFDGIPEREDEGYGYEPVWTVDENGRADIAEPFYVDEGSSLTVTSREGAEYRLMFGTDASSSTLIRRTVSFDDGEVITDLCQGMFMFPWDGSDDNTVTFEVLTGRFKVWTMEGWRTDPLTGDISAERPVYSLGSCGTVEYPVSLSATLVTLGVGDYYTLKAEQTVQDIYDAEDCEYLGGSDWSWKSDDSRIATVDKSGKIVGVSPGMTYITVTYGNGTMGFSRLCKVLVTE